MIDDNPTYGDLIDLLKDSEDCVDKSTSVPEVLYAKFQHAYPHVSIGRPKRFYDTVKRIAAPTQSSLRGDSKLSGSPLVAYRSKEWVPRTRNPRSGGKFLILYMHLYMAHT